ncbi:tol-pal system protein YbgF [Vreelandella azerica]|nr:tol-pal system protein YbgF [Halomonas azerica]
MNRSLAIWRHSLSEPKRPAAHHGKTLFGLPACAMGLTFSLSLMTAPVALAQQPIVQDLSASSTSSFYQQADTQTATDGALVMFNQVQEHQREIQELRGQIEKLRYELEQLRNQGQQRYLDTDDRLTALESSVSTDNVEQSLDGDVIPVNTSELNNASEASDEAAEVSTEENDTPVSDRPSASTTSPEVQEAYQAAFAFVQAREFDDAISAFNAFVADYPDTRLTPNGYYWLGELHAANDDLGDAEVSFEKVINDFDGNNKVADALYKLGLVKARQGEAEHSRELLNRVREDFPESSAAGLAGDFLRQMPE